MSDAFSDQVIKDGMKVLQILTEEDRERVNLMIDARLHDEREKRNYVSQDTVEHAKFSGCGIFVATFAMLFLFLVSRPDGWPTCELPHRESINWSVYCMDTENNVLSSRYCGVDGGYYAGDKWISTRMIYMTNLGNWECVAASKDAAAFSCKQKETLPSKF